MNKINVKVKFGSKIEDVIHNDVLRDKRPMVVEDENNNLIFHMPDAVVSHNVAGAHFSDDGSRLSFRNSIAKEKEFVTALKEYILASAKGREDEKETIEELERLIPVQLFEVTEITVADNYIDGVS